MENRTPWPNLMPLQFEREFIPSVWPEFEGSAYVLSRCPSPEPSLVVVAHGEEQWKKRRGRRTSGARKWVLVSTGCRCGPPRRGILNVTVGYQWRSRGGTGAGDAFSRKRRRDADVCSTSRRQRTAKRGVGDGENKIVCASRRLRRQKGRDARNTRRTRSIVSVLRQFSRRVISTQPYHPDLILRGPGASCGGIYFATIPPSTVQPSQRAFPTSTPFANPLQRRFSR